MLFDVKSKCTHGDLEFVVINSAGLISIKEVESLLNLLLLLFGELSTLDGCSWQAASAFGQVSAVLGSQVSCTFWFEIIYNLTWLDLIEQRTRG